MVEDTIHKEDRYHQWLDTLTTNCQILYCCFRAKWCKRDLHWFLKSRIDSLLRKMRRLNHRFRLHTQESHLSESSVWSQQSSRPSLKEATQRPRREFLILQHTRVCRSWVASWTFSLLLMTFLCSKKTPTTALFHEIGRITGASLVGFSFFGLG